MCAWLQPEEEDEDADTIFQLADKTYSCHVEST